MRRRSFLAAAATTPVAGCVSWGAESDGGSTPTEEPEPTAAPTATPAPTPVPPTYELVSFDVPETVEISTSVELSITVRNTGEETGDFNPELEYRGVDESWETSRPFRATVPPGEERTAIAGFETGTYLTTVDFRIPSLGASASMNVVGKTLPFDELYEHASGMWFGVRDVTFDDHYDYETNFGTREAVPRTGQKFAFVLVHALNQAGEPTRAPVRRNFDIVSGSTQYEPQRFNYTPVNYDIYQGGLLQVGVERRGVIPFELDESEQIDDIEVVWSADYSTGTTTVYWSDNG